MTSSTPVAPAGTRVHPDATVHRSAVIEGDVEIGPGTTLGPGCVVLGTVGPVRIGADCTLVANAIVKALRDGVEDVYPGDVAQEWLERWRDNPKVLERELAAGG